MVERQNRALKQTNGKQICAPRRETKITPGQARNENDGQQININKENYHEKNI
jgi:hypothetical protein